jgi:hypothetical protein
MAGTAKTYLHFAKPLDQIALESNLTMDQLIGKLGKITKQPL